MCSIECFVVFFCFFFRICLPNKNGQSINRNINPAWTVCTIILAISTTGLVCTMQNHWHWPHTINTAAAIKKRHIGAITAELQRRQQQMRTHIHTRIIRMSGWSRSLAQLTCVFSFGCNCSGLSLLYHLAQHDTNSCRLPYLESGMETIKQQQQIIPFQSIN